MNVINFIKGVIGRMFKKDVKEVFKANIITSDAMDIATKDWYNIVTGQPKWISKEDDIESINFAKFISSDTAKKICLDIDINVDGSARAEYLQSVIDKLKKVLRDKVEDACASGGIMLRPNGSGNISNCIDYVQAGDFYITDMNTNGDILGCIFIDHVQSGKYYYKRLEHQRFENGYYVITNKAFRSDKQDEIGKEVPLTEVHEWSGIEPEVAIENVEAPLFAYFKMPYNNTIDYDSPLGVSVFSNAIKELRDLDIAWSRKSGEVEDSKHITFVGPSAIRYAQQEKVKLPRFMHPVDLSDDITKETVHEHVATLLTEQRIADINSILSMISTKCGFSQGQFVLDRKTGNITATQVEADDRETIETIKDMRDALKDALNSLLYALNVYADLYDLAPVGTYKASYSFSDLTYSYDEDRNRWYQYALQGKVPFWMYLMKFEGMSEKEAKEVIKEAVGEKDEKGIFEEE